jgi:anion-transporting  ArsA/GET3 family ATPase
MALINMKRNTIMFDKLNEVLAQTQELLKRVAQYSQSIQEVQMVCNHPQQIIDLQ